MLRWEPIIIYWLAPFLDGRTMVGRERKRLCREGWIIGASK